MSDELKRLLQYPLLFVLFIFSVLQWVGSGRTDFFFFTMYSNQFTMLLAIIVVAVFFIDVVELMLGVQKSVLEVANSVRDKKKIDSNVSDIRNDLSNVMDDDQLDTIDRKLAELQYMNSDD